MITLLRKIRKQLITKGNFTSYLLYALGEILLVVIGILIALQINNWNEVRKEKAIEQELLLQFQTDLSGDIAALTTIDNNYSLKIKPPMCFSIANADFLIENLDKVLLEDFLKK